MQEITGSGHTFAGAVFIEFLLPRCWKQSGRAWKRAVWVEYLKVDIDLAGGSRRSFPRSISRDFFIDDLPIGAFIVQGREVRLDPSTVSQGELHRAADLRLTVLFWKKASTLFLGKSTQAKV